MSDRPEIQMLHDRVMVEPSTGERERRSSGGIVIPATAAASKRLVWGEVRGVGHHVRSVAVGDRVLYHPEDHFEVDVSGRSFVVLRERDLHAVASGTPGAAGSPSAASNGTGLYL